MDYYVEHVLSNRSKKKWGGGEKKRLFKTEDKYRLLRDTLVRDLRENLRPNLWTVDISMDMELDMWVVRYYITDKRMKLIVRDILSVSDRHIVRSYIDMLEARHIIRWEKYLQGWVMDGRGQDDDGTPLLAFIIRDRRLWSGTKENTFFTESLEQQKQKQVGVLANS